MKPTRCLQVCAQEPGARLVPRGRCREVAVLRQDLQGAQGVPGRACSRFSAASRAHTRRWPGTLVPRHRSPWLCCTGALLTCCLPADGKTPAQSRCLQGNEFSYYMLLTSAFLLNHTSDTEQWTVYPWALSSCNQLSDADQLRPVRCPSTPQLLQLTEAEAAQSVC